MKIRGLVHKVLPVSIIFLAFFGIFHLNLINNFDNKQTLGNLNRSDPQLPRCASTVNAYALVIGINDYPGTENDLSYCAADANSFDSMLQGIGFPGANIEKLTNSLAKKSNIIAKINTIRQKITRNDIFVMYYSGHGDRVVDQTINKTCSISTTHPYSNYYDSHWTIHEDGALAIRVKFSNFNTYNENDVGYVTDPANYEQDMGIPYSGNLGTFWSDWILGDTLIVGLVSNNLYTSYGFDVTAYQIASAFDSTIVNWDFDSAGEFWGHELDTYLDTLPCLNQFYFFDSCMSGGLIDSLAQRGRTILTACRDEESSWETSTLGHGIFTYYLLHVFDKSAGQYIHDLNGDKQISVVEMFNWTEPNTITKSTQLGEVQHPQFYNNPISCGIWNLTLLNIDTDADRLCDWGETNYWGSNPLNIESDNDGLLDGDEVELYGSSPAKFDTDSDHLGDWEEALIFHTNPASSDTDSDLLLDLEEIYTYGTNPSVADTDGDALLDGLEIQTYFTNPFNVDSDSDSVWDGPEVLTYFTNPLNPDSDGDGFSDGIEVYLGENPLDGFSPWNIILLIGILVALGIFVTIRVNRYRKTHVARPRQAQQVFHPNRESAYQQPQQVYGSPVPTRDTLSVDFTPDGIPIFEGLTEPQWVAIGRRLTAEGRTADAETCFRIAYILLRTKKPTGWKAQSQFSPQPIPSPASSMTPQARAKFYFEKGCSQYRDGLYSDAEQSFRAALKNDPSHAEAWRFLGLALVQLDEKGEAERAFWNAVHYDPNNPRGWANLGDLLLDQGIPSEAEIAFRRCLEVAPPGWSWRALAEKKLQQAKSRAYEEQGLNDKQASTTSLHEIPLPNNELDSETKTPDNLPPQEEPSQDTPEVENKQIPGEKPVEASSETYIIPDPESAQPTVEDVPEEQKIPQSLGNEAPTEVYLDNQSGEQIPLIPISPTSTPESTSQVKPPPEMEIIEKCGFCGNLVKNRECISCGAKICPWCKEMNFVTATVCVNCGKDLNI